MGWPGAPTLPRAVAPVGIGIALAGGYLAISTLKLLRSASASTDVTFTSDNLVETGAYRYSRNPVYLAYLLTSLGMSLTLRNSLGLLPPIVVFAVLNFLVIPIEERELSAKFNDSFETYKGQVRRWI